MSDIAHEFKNGVVVRLDGEKQVRNFGAPRMSEAQRRALQKCAPEEVKARCTGVADEMYKLMQNKGITLDEYVVMIQDGFISLMAQDMIKKNKKAEQAKPQKQDNSNELAEVKDQLAKLMAMMTMTQAAPPPVVNTQEADTDDDSDEEN